jgi:hypothetical protein
MNFLRPRSLSALVLLGLAVIALPLVAGLVTAGLQMRRLAETSERIVAEGVVATRLTQELFAQSASLERQLRLYQVLGDPKLVETYAAQNGRLREIETRLDSRLRLGSARDSLREFTRLRNGISVQVLDAARSPPDYARLLGDFARMQQLAVTSPQATRRSMPRSMRCARARNRRSASCSGCSRC